MKYRSSTEIIDSILRSVGSGATRTRIMYKSYLSYTQLNEYLSLLLERDLIRFEPETQIYKVTQNSAKFLDAYEQIRELVQEPKMKNIEELR